jgi:hypothetical protein
MWKFLSRKPISPKSAESQVSGVSIIFLQKQFESFTTEQLIEAMKKGWRRDPDPVTFFATSVGNGEGAVIKLNGMFITMQFFDRRLDTSSLGEQELPQWAIHQAHFSVTYVCPGGIPEGEVRDQFYGLLGLLCAELVDGNILGLFFMEEQVLLRNQPSLVQELRSGNNINPARLAATHR